MIENDLHEKTDHEQYMRRCIELMIVAQSRGNTPIGSIVVVNGEIVGEGIEAMSARSASWGSGSIASQMIHAAMGLEC